MPFKNTKLLDGHLPFLYISECPAALWRRLSVLRVECSQRNSHSALGPKSIRRQWTTRGLKEGKNLIKNSRGSRGRLCSNKKRNLNWVQLIESKEVRHFLPLIRSGRTALKDPSFSTHSFPIQRFSGIKSIWSRAHRWVPFCNIHRAV